MINIKASNKSFVTLFSYNYYYYCLYGVFVVHEIKINSVY